MNNNKSVNETNLLEAVHLNYGKSDYNTIGRESALEGEFHGSSTTDNYTKKQFPNMDGNNT
jgi:hypothetical protein